jgi:hypothetical protein
MKSLSAVSLSHFRGPLHLKGTSGVAGIAENKFYVARRAPRERDSKAASRSGCVKRKLRKFARRPPGGRLP